MAVEAAPPTTGDAGADALRPTIIRLAREALTATLATLDTAGGHPYASLVELATTGDGRPLLLLSDLARHTRNLEADTRVSLLVDRRHDAGALALERAAFIGRAVRSASVHDRARFLRRHPSAAQYADFSDFAFWTIEPVTIHVIAGFGRIREIAALNVLCRQRVEAADDTVAAAAETARIAAVSAVLPDIGWSIAGIDDEGIDLLPRRSSASGRWIAFPQHIAADGDPAAIARLVVESFASMA